MIKIQGEFVQKCSCNDHDYLIYYESESACQAGSGDCIDGTADQSCVSTTTDNIIYTEFMPFHRFRRTKVQCQQLYLDTTTNHYDLTTLPKAKLFKDWTDNEFYGYKKLKNDYENFCMIGPDPTLVTKGLDKVPQDILNPACTLNSRSKYCEYYHPVTQKNQRLGVNYLPPNDDFGNCGNQYNFLKKGLRLKPEITQLTIQRNDATGPVTTMNDLFTYLKGRDDMKKYYVCQCDCEGSASNIDKNNWILANLDDVDNVVAFNGSNKEMAQEAETKFLGVSVIFI